MDIVPMITNRLRNPATIGSAYYLFFWSMFALYIPFFNVYLKELGLTGVQIGIVGALSPLMVLTVGPMVSAMADRRSQRRRFLRFSFIGLAIVLLLYRFPTSFWGIFVLVLFEATIRSPMIPIADSIIVRMATNNGLNYGGMRMWGSLGFAVMAIMGGILWGNYGYTPMFMVTAVAIIPSLWLTNHLPETTPRPTKSRRIPRQFIHDPALLTMYIGALLVGVGLFATMIFGGIHIVQLGGTQLHVGLLFGLSALTEVPIMRSSDWLIARFRGERVLLFSYIMLGISFVAYAVAWSPWALIVGAIIKGVGYGLFFVVTVRLIDSRVPAEWVSTAQSLYAACFMGLSPLLTTALSGYVFDKWGAGWLFGGSTAVVVIAVILLAFASHRGWFNQTIDWETS